MARALVTLRAASPAARRAITPNRAQPGQRSLRKKTFILNIGLLVKGETYYEFIFII
jgi:hypothetical protein